MRSRLLIVDDNARFVQAARDLLQRQGADVVGVASNAAEAIRLAGELQPDCVLVDIDLGPESGFDLASRLTAEHHQRVVLVSVHNEAEFIDRIATTSALGFIPKADLSVGRIREVLDDVALRSDGEQASGAMLKMRQDFPGVSRGTRVVLAEDDTLLREGTASLLEAHGFDVVGQSGDAAGLLERVRSERPDLVIVDIRMPPTHTTEGLDAAHAIRAEFPDIAIVVLSAHAELDQATDLIGRGERSGYLLKSRVIDVDDFIETLHRIVAGGTFVDPALVHALVTARRIQDPLDALSSREREVLALMAEGRSNAGIAHELYVSDGTIEKHIRSILMKLNITEAADDHRRVLAVLTYLDTR
jgi:serine/threonine-protein kinase PknK